MDWKQELFKRLDALGEKLGVAAGHIWAVLVRQGLAEAMGSLLLTILCLIGLVACIKVLLWAQKTGEATRRSPSCDWNTRYIGWSATSIVCGIVAILALCFNSYKFVVWAINPEYFALEKVLSMFGK